MSFSASCLQPLHSSAGFIQLPSLASATRDSHPQPAGGRLTSLCLLSKLTGLPPTHINCNYISSFLLLFFFGLHLFKTAQCHFIYLLESCTNLSLNRMIYPCQGAAVWIMCSNCSLFCFNWVFWKGDGGQPLLVNVLLVFIAARTGTWGVREIWQHRSSQESNTRSRSTFFQAGAGGTTLVRSIWTDWVTGELNTGSSVCKGAQFQLQGRQWCTFALAPDCKFVYLKTANTCFSVNLSMVYIMRLFWAHRSSIFAWQRQITLNFHSISSSGISNVHLNSCSLCSCPTIEYWMLWSHWPTIHTHNRKISSYVVYTSLNLFFSCWHPSSTADIHRATLLYVFYLKPEIYFSYIHCTFQVDMVNM